jgi:hypothetical protein
MQAMEVKVKNCTNYLYNRTDTLSCDMCSKALNLVLLCLLDLRLSELYIMKSSMIICQRLVNHKHSLNMNTKVHRPDQRGALHCYSNSVRRKHHIPVLRYICNIGYFDSDSILFELSL